MSESTGATPEIEAPADAPNWSTFKLQLSCPRCAYNLYMLTVARCPECGLGFAWAEVIAAAQTRIDSPLFEHRWRQRPIRSFFGTLFRTLSPWRLWRTARIEHIPRVGVLTVFVLILGILAAIALMTWWSADALALGLRLRVGWDGAWQFLRDNFRWFAFYPVVPLCLVVGFGPLVAVLLAMHVFRVTLVRHAIRSPHLFRIAVLAWAGMVVIRYVGLFAATVTNEVALRLLQPGAGQIAHNIAERVFDAFGLGTVALLFVTLSLAYRNYLRLPRPWFGGLLTIVLAYSLMFTSVLFPLFYYSRSMDNAWLQNMDNWFPGARRLVLWLLTGHWA